MNPFDQRRVPRDATFDGRPALAPGGSAEPTHNLVVFGIDLVRANASAGDRYGMTTMTKKENRCLVE
jgi:hypothetical protein